MTETGNHSAETGPVADLDQVIEQYHQAAGEFVRGNPRPIQLLFTRRDDVSLLDPTGGVQRGWEAVAHRQQRNAVVRDAEPGTFERVVTYITPQLASIVDVEPATPPTGAATRPKRCEFAVLLEIWVIQGGGTTGSITVGPVAVFRPYRPRRGTLWRGFGLNCTLSSGETRCPVIISSR